MVGNLLYKLYEYLRKKYKVSTEGKYLYTSRKAAVGANISDSELYEYALKYFGVEREKLCDLLEISSDRFEEEITQNRKHYYEYLDLLGIDINKKYVLCDLISSGTTLLYMNQMFKCKMRGFFLGYILTEDNTDKKEKDVFRNRFNGETQWYTNQLELFLTSPEASVKCFKPGGKVEFGKDIRTKRDISLLKKVQNTIYNDVVKNYSRYYSTDISKTLVFELFKYSKQVFINGNAKVLGECVLYDDTTTKIYRVFENIYE